MKVRTPAVFMALAAAAALLLAGCTPPLADNFEYQQATLGPQGGSIDVTVTFTCQPGLNIAFGTARLVQTRQGRLAQGDASFVKDFPGVPCNGRLQGARMTVFNTSPWAFTTGKASINGDLTLFDDNTGDLPTVTAGPRDIWVSRTIPQSGPVQQRRPAPDRRYSS